MKNRRFLLVLVPLAFIIASCASVVTPTPVVVTQNVEVTSTPVPVTPSATAAPSDTPTPEASPTMQVCKTPAEVKKDLEDQLRANEEQLKGWKPVFGVELSSDAGASCVFAVTLQKHGAGERNTEQISLDVFTSMTFLTKTKFTGSYLAPFVWVALDQEYFRQQAESFIPNREYGGFLLYIKQK